MDEAPSPLSRPRSPFVAVILSLLFPGLGHQYTGDARIARRVLIAVGVGWSAVLSVAVLLDVDPLVSLAFSVAIGVSAQIGIAVDARRRAKRRVDHYEMRPCNRPVAYLGYFAMWAVLVAVPNELRRAYVVETFKTPSESLAPTLVKGDHFIVTKLGPRDRDPQRGDVVVFEYPPEPSETFVKRLIGLPGETVEIDPDGQVRIDGVPLPREEVAPPAWAEDGARARYVLEHTPEGASYTVKHVRTRNDLGPPDPDAPLDTDAPRVFPVPPGHVFVLGDNRDRSHDSAAFGPVPIELLRGRARAIWLPFDRAGELD